MSYPWARGDTMVSGLVPRVMHLFTTLGSDIQYLAQPRKSPATLIMTLFCATCFLPKQPRLIMNDINILLMETPAKFFRTPLVAVLLLVLGQIVHYK